MAVERLTDYTRRIWTGLGPDDPTGHDIHVNDVIYYMDSSECCIVSNVYPDGSIDCETLPDIGGGGGGYSADDNVRMQIHNSSGYAISNYGVYYISDPAGLAAYNYASLSNGSNGTRTLLNQNGWVSLRCQFTSTHTVARITYNDDELEFLQHKASGPIADLLIRLPENLDYNIPIYIY